MNRFSRRAATGLITLLSLVATGPLHAQDEPRTDSPLIRLLKSGKVPADRQVTLIDQLGKRGNANDLAFLYDKALQTDGFPIAARRKALEALVEAAQIRRVQPASRLNRLSDLLKPTAKVDPAVRLAAIRLAGLWKLEQSTPLLISLAVDPKTTDDARAAVFDALATLNKKDAIIPLADRINPVPVRMLALAALARIGDESATPKAVALLGEFSPGESPTPLIAAFLDRKDGADKLAKAISKARLSQDAAKLALRSVYELGRTDAVLVTELTRAAGLSNEVKPPTAAEINALIAEVQSKGDAARGEQVFRRADVNCVKCHALAGAGGGVGPELSPIGSTSPVDYLIYSILVPDQSIKEEFHTKVFQLADGRVLQGIVVDKDEKRTVLKEATGDLKTIAADDIEESKDGGSLMPKGLTNFLTHAEFIDLLRFLSELGKPGPYAIRPVPSIQRWRVLRSPAAEVTETVPSSDVFAAQVLSADPARWVPAYGKVGGDLPFEELASIAGSNVYYVQGELDASGEGSITMTFDSPDGLNAWLDEEALKLDGKTVQHTLTPGRHKLTVRVDPAKRSRQALKVEVSRGEGSSAEFRVVGGR